MKILLCKKHISGSQTKNSNDTRDMINERVQWILQRFSLLFALADLYFWHANTRVAHVLPVGGEI